jgi:mycothiol synthase
VSDLPAGLRSAPLTRADLREVAAVWRACELHDDGEPDVTEDDLIAFSGRPSLEFARDTVCVRDGDAIVAFGVQIGHRITFVHVLPEYRCRGIGTWLMRWSQDAARAIGARDTAQEISEGEPGAIALLESDGYTRRWDSWAFTIALEAAPAAPVVADGYAIRGFVPGQDERAAYDVIQTAFSEWPEHEPSPFPDWRASTLGHPGFSPELLSLAVRGDEVVGAVLVIEADGEGWIEQLAVARAHRGHGLGMALLMHAFGLVRRRGGARCGLGTDSRTGARGLYEKVGMRVRKTFGEYAKEL